MMTRSREPIHKLPPNARGLTRYRVTVDGPRDPRTGKRKQLKTTVGTYREARGWLSATRSSVTAGTYVTRERTTLAEYLQGWVAGRTDLKAGTRENYRHALQIPIKTLGTKQLQQVSKADLDRMVAGMLDGSLRQIGKKGRPLSPRSVRLTLVVLAMAMEAAIAEGRLPRNVAKLVARPKQERVVRTIWESPDVAAFLTVSDADRLAGAWRLSLAGLRRGEVLGMSWSDLDLDAGTARVHRSRVEVAGRVIEQTTKSSDSERVVPLSPDSVAALRRTRAVHAEEQLASGQVYRDGGLLAVDALGGPVTPRWYSDRFKALAREAEVPVVSLHTARHGYGSHLLDQGVPLPIVSQVMGHASVDITANVYAHALKAGADERVRAAMVAAGL